MVFGAINKSWVRKKFNASASETSCVPASKNKTIKQNSCTTQWMIKESTVFVPTDIYG